MHATPTQRLAQQTIRGLYGITPDITRASQIDLLLQHIEAALQHGLRLLQLRNKSLPPTDLQTLGERTRQLCYQYQATLIVNDSLSLARHINADGVHLGNTDCPLASARQQLAPTQMIGVSCYNQPSLASQVAQQGADYIAFGSVFSSPTKPNAVHASLDLLTQAHTLGIPCVAIGGITRQNGHVPLQAGAQAIAVISDLFGDLLGDPAHPNNSPADTARRTQDWQTLIQSTNQFSS